MVETKRTKTLVRFSWVYVVSDHGGEYELIRHKDLAEQAYKNNITEYANIIANRSQKDARRLERLLKTGSVEKVQDEINELTSCWGIPTDVSIERRKVIHDRIPPRGYDVVAVYGFGVVKLIDSFETPGERVVFMDEYRARYRSKGGDLRAR